MWVLEQTNQTTLPTMFSSLLKFLVKFAAVRAIFLKIFKRYATYIHMV